MGELVSWNKVMDTALSMPLVKVDRTEFLTKEFSMYGNTDLLNCKRPIDIYNENILENVAKSAINSHLIKVTATSAAVGMPGGFAMAATIPTDIAQYYWHVLVLAQKLGYIYGWPDLLDGKKEVSENTRNVLTLFVGVMFGVQAANKIIGEVAKQFSIQVAKRVPQQALTKTMYYPIIKQIAKWIGVKMTKDTFGKGLSKAIPVLGGIMSGTITAVSFKPMANKLQNELRSQMSLMKSLNDNVYFEEQIEDVVYEDCEKERIPVNLEKLKIQACINIAKIDFDFSEEEIEFISNMINDSEDLSDTDKMELLNQLHAKDLVDINFNILKEHIAYSTMLLESLICIVKVDNIVKPAEKIYLFKIAHDLGFDKEMIKEMLENSDHKRFD